MKLIVDNIKTSIQIGGADYLYKTEFVKELRQYMRERPEGYARVPTFRNKQWDGYRYFITPKGVFATGYLPMVLNFLQELAKEEQAQRPEIPLLTIELEDRRNNLVQMLPANEFVETIGDKSLRDYQQKVIETVRNSVVTLGTQTISFQRGIIDSATNSGKTMIMGGLIANTIKPKVLVLVDRGLVFGQLKEYLSQFGELGIVGEGKCEFADITVAMAQTLYRLDSLNIEKHLKQFNAVFMDEGHKAASTTYTAILSKLEASMRLVISGTPLDMKDKVVKMTIVGISGVPLVKITNQEMIDAEVSLKPIIHLHRINDAAIVLSSKTYAAQAAAYYSSNEAVLKIIEILSKEKKDTLITFNYEAHGSFVYNALVSSGVQCLFTHGKDKARVQKIEDFKARKTTVLIASMILKEGVNITNIQRIIRLEGGKSDITTKQIVGRGLRVDEANDDKEVEIHDFYIDGKYLQKHSITRIGTYRAEGFELVFHYETKTGRPTKTSKK